LANTSNLAPGARVIVRDEEWVVRGRTPLRQGGDAVRVTGISELVRNHEACFLSSLDQITEMRPEETVLVADDSPHYRRSRLYLESLLRRTPPTDQRLYIGHRAAMRSMQYQLDPAEKALQALRPRILIADGVGLGKTLEVGVLLSELIKRGRGERILVVAVRSMLAQFQQELWQRFCIPLVRLDSVGLQRVRAKIPANKNPFYHYNRAIISVDTLKNDGRYRHYLEEAHWDAIVIDECQNVANANTQRTRVAELLARTCDALILTSATPHNGKPESFARLMNMLEPTAIADDRDYTRDDIKGLYVRRFKKDVAQEASSEFAERDEALVRFESSQREEAALRAIYDLEFHTLNTRSRRGGDILFRHTLLKGFLSSPQACAETIRGRLARIEKRLEDEPPNADKLRNDRVALTLLLPTIEAIGANDCTRYAALKGELGRVGWTGKANSPRVIIFSERISSLRFLIQQIMADFPDANASSVVEFHAGLPDVEQQRIVESFGSEDSKLRMLLCTDVASEGINLHFFCHHLIHWDISWSLITTAQRNGRIDRFGQEQQPVVRYLMLGTQDERVRGDLRIIERLIEKEKEAEKNLGDAAAILGLYEAEAEEEHVQAAMASDEDPEDVFRPQPDEDQPGAVDFFELMLRDPSPPARSAGRCAEPATLYRDDLDFAREAFEEIADRDPLFRRPDFHPDQPSFTFIAPDDLKDRCQFMPQEALPERWEFLLTTDREAVLRSIESARQEEGQWPRMHLLWELHPVTQWLTEKVLVGFERNEAPVLLTDGLEAGEGLYLFQGILSNRRAQPLIAEWFGLLWKEGKLAGDVWPLDRVLDTLGLRESLTNSGRSSQTASALQAGLLGAVAAARAYVDGLRRDRSEEMSRRLHDDLERLREWRNRALRAVEMPDSLFPELEARRLPRPLLERKQERQRHIQRLYEAREADLGNTFTAEPVAYVRLAAVFCAD